MISPEKVRVLPVTSVPVREKFVAMRSGKGRKVAVTFLAWVIVTVQVPVPEHPSPDQPVNEESMAGLAVKVTEAPSLKSAAQVAPQSIPAGLDVTVPAPLPDFKTERVKIPQLGVIKVPLATKWPLPIEYVPKHHPPQLEE